MRILSIAVLIVTGFYGARIADNPLGGLAAMVVAGAILLLVQRLRDKQKRRQSNPPKRP